jgi:uncharacterized membrane protein YfcA
VIEDPTIFALIAGTVFLSGLVQGTIGFGFGLVSMALLPDLVGLKFAVPFVSIFCMCVQIFLLTKLWTHLRWSALKPMVLGALIGTPLGIYALKGLSPQLLKLMLGSILTAYALLSFRKSGQRKRDLPSSWGVAAGFAGGALGGAFNTGGPPAVMYVSAQPWTKDRTTATLQGFFCAINGVQIVGYSLTGLITVETLRADLFFIGFVLVGTFVGSRLYDRMNQAIFERVMMLGIFGLGLSYILRNIGA